MTPKAPELPEDISDRLSEAYEVFEAALEDIEAYGLVKAKQHISTALELYTTLYGEAQNVIIQQQTFGGILAEHEYTNDLLHLVIARSALEMYTEMLQDPDITLKNGFEAIEEEALTPKNGVYNYERLIELGQILAYQNRIEDTQRILKGIMYLE